MKPKYSTGYLTPQANKAKRNTNLRLSESHETLGVMMDLNDSLIENLMSCPIKRQLVLNLIASEKDTIENYKKREDRKKKGYIGSPLSKVQKKHLCESPTALLRRRALEQQTRESPTSENQVDDNKSRSSSCQSSVSSSGSSLIPFNKLLDGIIAYVEIKSKDEKDRSQGAKALLKTMGAIVRDTFTKDVTHVIFKDGSFTTYQKAKLMKVHLVSVLWIEAVRSNNSKVSEKKFPALGTDAYDHNVSSICSQMQRDYEEIIREELHRSLAAGTPLPSKQSFIDRRRTIMTPMPSTSQEFQSSQDREVDQIFQRGRKTNNFDKASSGSPHLSRMSPEITDDDSDMTPCINGSIIKRRQEMIIHIAEQDKVVINSVKDLDNHDTLSIELTNTDGSNLTDDMEASKNRKKPDDSASNMDFTTLNGRLFIDESIDGNTKENEAPNTSDDSIYHKKTPKLKSKKGLETNRAPKRSANSLFSMPDESMVYKRRTRQLKGNIDIPSDNSTNVSNEAFLKDKSDNSSRSAMSTLQLSYQDGIHILNKNTCTTTTDPLQIRRVDLATAPVQISAEKLSSNSDKSTSTNMSSLRVSTEKPSSNVEKSTSTDMSSLRVSTEKPSSNVEKSTTTSMSLLQVSSDSNMGKANIAEKSSSTNMSPLLISSDSIKDKSNGSAQADKTESNNNFVNIDDKNKSSNGTPPKKVGLNRSLESDMSLKNSLSSNVVTKDVLDATSLPDAHVTKRRGRYSANKNVTDVSRRKTIYPEDDGAGSESSRKPKGVLPKETSPPKKLKINLKFEETETPKKTNTSSEETESDTRKPRGRRQASNRTKPDFNSKKTGGTKSKTKTSSTDSQSPSESSGCDRKVKKLRKLYNPDESIQDVIDSDKQEREDKRTKVRNKRCDEGVILNPNIVCITSNILLTAKAKAFADNNNIDVQTVLNKESEDSEQEKTSAEAKKNNKHQTRISVDSDADEQQELAEEFVNKKKTKTREPPKKLGARSEGKVVKRRQSSRLSQRPQIKFDLSSSTSDVDECKKPVRSLQHLRKKLYRSTSSSDERTIIPITPVNNRRSTMEFQTLSQMSAKKRLKIDKSKRPSIVCTKMHKDEIQVFNQIVRKLGGFVIEDEVSTKTTHLVAGEPKRTINMLRAIAMGCWILKHEWLMSSLEEGRWLPEEDYEQTDFSPAVQKCRLQRQAFGPCYSMDIFQHCEPIYIARGSIPRCSDLRELVCLCKGKVVNALRNAGIVVGERVRHEGVTCVKENWILDSITFNKKMPLKKYILPPNNNDSPGV